MASFARYEGAWLREQANWYGEQERFTVSTPTDPAHGDKSDAPMPLQMDAPTLQGGGEIYFDGIFELYEEIPPSTLIDETPVRGHGTPEATGHGFGGLTTPGADISALAARRGIDTGASVDQSSDSPIYRKADENYFGTHTVGMAPPPITQRAGGDPVLRRGLNGYPDNDGDGGRPTSWSVDEDVQIVGGTWRKGDYEQSNVQRRFRPPNRRHGEVKMVEADINTIIGDIPPPDKPDTYASPFSSLQKFVPKRRKVMGIRRDPGPWDEDLQARDPSFEGTVSVDGMVAQ